MPAIKLKSVTELKWERLYGSAWRQHGCFGVRVRAEIAAVRGKKRWSEPISSGFGRYVIHPSYAKGIPVSKFNQYVVLAGVTRGNTGP
jgi:hypothetical protein